MENVKKLNKIHLFSSNIKRNWYSIILVLVFITRLFCYEEKISGYIELNSYIGSPLLTALTLIVLWMQYACVIAVIMKPFFKIKVIDDIVRFICPIVFILNLVLIKPIMKLFVGEFELNTLLIVYLLESLIALSISLISLIKNLSKTNLKSLLQMFSIFLLMMVCVMPSYMPQFMFGYGNPTIIVNDITFAHRVMLYIGIIVPVCMYFILRNKDEAVIRFTLIYLAVGTLVTFVRKYNYTDFSEPWNWPFHLCNTAMFIIPLCLIFKLNKLFYFTYFINVLGALLAMLMPNYPDSTNIMSTRIFEFWYNHWIAFFMPLLIVALKQFKRPKLKEFYWSMVWFFGYFVLVLILNVVFEANGHKVDFFFINSNFIADKLGTWAENIFNISATISLGGKDLVFHPVYQLLFFLVYVALGLGVWFVYSEFFRIAEDHANLHVKLQKINQYELALASKLDATRKEELMNSELKASLELKHFSKKYATSNVFAVEDANLEVHAGEIFGFLGPNGAGKSTIIKSIVGIQPITSGNIEICGIDVQGEPVLAKYNIGYVPDHYALYEKLTGREYINYIADIYEVSIEDRNERIEKYIKLFELEHSIDSKMKTYSHGMKQKITIMAALVHNPKVWILDEPLTGLDPNSIYQVKECMKQHAAEGNIVFFSSHIIDIVEKLCQRIAIIKKGHIQCVKTVEEIEQSGKSLEQFYLEVIDAKEE